MDANGNPLEVLRITPVIVICAGILTMLVCRPLINGRVRPNGMYGIRTPNAFRSDECWYRINRLGGLVLFRWGFWTMLLGLSGLVLPTALLLA